MKAVRPDGFGYKDLHVGIATVGASWVLSLIVYSSGGLRGGGDGHAHARSLEPGAAKRRRRGAHGQQVRHDVPALTNQCLHQQNKH